MNSSERHEHRYQRRKEKREKSKLNRNEQLGSLEEYSHTVRYSKPARSVVEESGGRGV